MAMVDGELPAEDGRAVRAMVSRFFSLAGIDEGHLAEDAAAEWHRTVSDLRQHGFREPHLAVMGQAYIRAIGRIAAAEAEAISHFRARAMDDADMASVAEGFLVLGRDVFETLHARFLSRALAWQSGDVGRLRGTAVADAVAHVAVVNSTGFLREASVTNTNRLIDGLFASAQACVRGRGVEVTKYVGDGVFLGGPDPEDVGLAALGCIQGLSASAGLSSRAGLAYGPVVHRAGDVFGLPVNIAHALTKAARPGALLAYAFEGFQLPETMRRKIERVVIRGVGEAIDAFEMTPG